MNALSKRHRRAVRSLFGLLLLFAFATAAVGYYMITKFEAAPPRILPPVAAASPVQKPPPETIDLDAPSAPRTAAPTALATSPVHAPLLPPAVRPSARAATPHPLPSPSAVSDASVPQKPEPQVSFGQLTLDTSPWSIVSVGGKMLGQTPLVGVKLPAGTQMLSLKNPEQGIDTSYPVLIEAGKTTVRRIGIE